MTVPPLPSPKGTAQDLQREARDWFIRLRSDSFGSDEMIQWEAWLETAGAREAYDAVVSQWEIAGLVSLPPASPAEMARDDYRAQVPVQAWLSRRRATAWRLAAGFAAAALLVGSLFAWRQEAPPEPVREIATLRAQHGAARLPDGSVVQLGAMTKLQVAYSARRRSLMLSQGEARFQVAHNRERPFVVSTPLANVTAIGTAFDIDIGREKVELYVAEGVVEVDARYRSGQRDTTVQLAQPLRVTAGQKLTMDPKTSRFELDASGKAVPRDWRSGRLEYQDEKLSAVIDDVNRYAVRRIRVADPGIGEMKYTGTVVLSVADSWAEGLAGAFPLRVKSDSQGIELRPR